MTTTLKTLAASAVLALGAGSANAAVKDIGDIISFGWSDTPITQILDIEVTSDFRLKLDSYSGTGNEQTGFVLKQGGTNFTAATDACDSAGNEFFRDGCNLVTASTADGTDLLNQVLTAGSYRIGIYDSATPSEGQLNFQVAAVPLPAGGLLLLGGLGAIGALRRRKHAA